MDKHRIASAGISVIRGLYRIFYSRPKRVIALLAHPSIVISDSYFPEKKRASNLQIIADQVENILRFGDIDEYYYMYGLDVKSRKEKKQYVRYPVFMERRDRLNLSSTHNDSCILRNKLHFGLVAKGLGIPTPENVAFCQNGSVYLLDDTGREVKPEQLIASTESANWVYKPLDGECGAGITMIDIDDDNITVNGHHSSADDLSTLIRSGQAIIQRRLTQHPEMSRMYPLAVNTIRMITVRNLHTGGIEVLPPTLRIGAHGNLVDNFSRGGIIVAMDTDSGRLAPTGYFKPQYGFKSKCHPDTGVIFTDFTVPFYQEAKAMAIKFHSFLGLHSIGWDIAITENGPTFIEGNDNWEINLPQNADNPFLNDFKRLFY